MTYTSLSRRMPEADLQLIRDMSARFRRAGFECYLVGGSVRDLILDRPMVDLDLATNATPDDVKKIFRKVIPTGIQHGTVTVLMNGTPIEVTTYRTESTYSDGRHPDRVSFTSSLSEDLSRRDFTVNALAWDPLTDELKDEHNGLADLENRLIRTIGDPLERFTEDALRPIRACRFASTLGFSIHPQTMEAMKNPVLHSKVKNLAMERISAEIKKGLVANGTAMIAALEECGLLPLFLKELPFANLSSHGLDQIQKSNTCAWEYILSLWISDGGKYTEKGYCDEILTNWKLSGREMQFIRFYLQYIRFIQDFRSKIAGARLPSNARLAPPQEQELRQFASLLKTGLKTNTVAFIKGLCSEATSPFSVDFFLHLLATHPLTIADLKINGKDVMQAGYQGEAVGEMLTRALALVIEEPYRNERGALLEWLKSGKGE